MYIENYVESNSASYSYWIDSFSVSYNKTSGSSKTITIYRNVTGNTSVRLYVTGGKTQSENYGLGKHLDGSGTWVNNGHERNYTTVSFTGSETSKDVTLTTSNNGVYEFNKTIRVWLQGGRGAGTITLIDNNIPETSYNGTNYLNIINAKDPQKEYNRTTGTWTSTQARSLNYPLAGDGSTNDSTNFQAIINWLNSNGGGILYFPEGIYMIDNITLYPGVSFVGAGKSQTMIRRYSAEALFQTGNSYQRMMNCSYSGSSDSNPLTFLNLTLDGNMTPFAIKFTFTGQPTAGQSFTLDSSGETADTWTYVDGTPGARQIARGATYADTVTNTKEALEAAGYGVVRKSGDNYVISVYNPAWLYRGRYIHATENVSNLSLSTYEWASLLFVTASASYAGRLVAKYENVTVQNNPPSEGIHCNNNTDANFYYVDDGGYTPFGRGFLDCTGGYSIWRMKNVTGGGLHIEIDVYGYADPGDVSTKVLVKHYLEDCHFMVAGFAISDSYHWPYNSTDAELVCNRVTVTNGWKIYGPLLKYVPFGNVVFNDCVLNNTDPTTFGSVLDWPGNIQFNNCSFTLGSNAAVSNDSSNVITAMFKTTTFYRQNSTVYYLGEIRRANYSYEDLVFEVTTAGTSGGSAPTWNTTPGSTTNDGSVVWTCRNKAAYYQTQATADLVVEFNNCTFHAESGIPATYVMAVSNNLMSMDWNMFNNKLVMNDCTFTGALTHAFGDGPYGRGGIYEANNCVFNNTGMIFYKYNGGADRNWKITINGGTFNHGGQFGYIYNCDDSNNYIYLQGIVVPYDHSNITWSSYQASNLNMDRISGTGVMRQITGANRTPTSSDRGFRKSDGSCYDTWQFGSTTYKVKTVSPMAWETV